MMLAWNCQCVGLAPDLRARFALARGGALHDTRRPFCYGCAPQARGIMGSLHIRSLGRIILLAGLLSMCWPTAVNAQVSETSVEGQNITAAANFIRSMGMEEVADQIIQALKDGEIY